MAGRKKKMWFGFLEAGSKGSPVVRDVLLETGDSKTIYLFNFMKGRILEYRRDIVEVKLRELKPEELAMVPQLRKAYMEAQETFEPRTVRPRQAVYRPKPMPVEDDFPEFDAADDDEFDGVKPPLLDNDDDGAATFQLD